MNLTRCSNGHFYDMDKFDSCPHCLNGAGGENSPTTPLAGVESRNDGYMYKGDGGEVTVPMKQSSSSAVEETIPTEPVTTPAFQDRESSFPDRDANVVRKITPEKIPSQNNMTDLTGRVEKSDMSLSDLVSSTVTSRGSQFDETEKTIGIYAVKEKDVSVDPVVGWLVCVKGSVFGKSFVLKSGRNFIGRDSAMDVQIPGDKSISRQCHAVILYDPKSKMFLVQPGTSRELFYLNETVVLGVEAIKANDVITIGNTELMFIPCCSESFCWEDQIKKNKQEEEK